MFDGTTDRAGLLVADFARRRVLVLGDAILDEYLTGDCSRISPEAPVPVMRVVGCRRTLGGAANTAANIVSLGGHATLIALIGEDEGGRTLVAAAADAGVDVSLIRHELPTLRKTRVVSQQQQIVRLDYEDVQPPSPSCESAILAAFEAELDTCDIVVISDYAKGFVSPFLAQRIIERAHGSGRQVIIDPRPQHGEAYRGCDYLTPNWKEARALLHLPDAELTPGEISTVARDLASRFEASVVLTLGHHGIAFCDRDGSKGFVIPARAREVFDVSGAGDTVVAAFALARASGASPEDAVAIANEAASVVVAKFGTATVTADEILKDRESLKIVSRQGLSSLAATVRAQRKRIVTLNGSFDVLHAGHLHILREARKCGDVVIVGLNSDASVRGYKGPGRPVVPEKQRAEMLLALRMVDYVHIFDEADPIAFLSEVRPDVHVNGAEYGEYCIEAETVRRFGGTLHLVGRIPGLSTSAIVEVMRSVGVGPTS